MKNIWALYSRQRYEAIRDQYQASAGFKWVWQPLLPSYKPCFTSQSSHQQNNIILTFIVVELSWFAWKICQNSEIVRYVSLLTKRGFINITIQTNIYIPTYFVKRRKTKIWEFWKNEVSYYAKCKCTKKLSVVLWNSQRYCKETMCIFSATDDSHSYKLA